MIQFNPTLLNEKIAPGIAEFNSAEIADLRSDFDQGSHWLENQHLNSLFGPTYTNNWKQWSINLLFRAQSQFSFYHQALEATSEFLRKSTHHNPAVGAYFNALALWETSFLNFQIFLNLYNKAISTTTFHAGDGSEEERAYGIANSIKHWGSDIEGDRHDAQHTIPLWLSNSGFHTRTHELSYLEFAAITKEIGRTANFLDNPVAP